MMGNGRSTGAPCLSRATRCWPSSRHILNATANCACYYAYCRPDAARPIRPATVATAPPTSNQMVLSVGEPVNSFDT